MSSFEWNDEKRDELVEFVLGMRAGPDRDYWFIGKYLGDKEDHYLCESMRGDFKEQVWTPDTNERKPCCDVVDTSQDPLALLEHCATKAHIEQLVDGLTPEQKEREYQYMLSHVFESLTDDWEDRV